MAGFYYFFRSRSLDEVAKGEDLNHNLLAEYGLAEVLADVRKVTNAATAGHCVATNVGSNAGPGKSCGVMLAINSKYTGAPCVVGNKPDRQQWFPVDEAKGLWIGVLKNELPRPEDLERHDIIWGVTVKDPQHHEWRIPICRLVSQGLPYGNLPQSYRFDAAGEPHPQLAKSHEWLWNFSGEIQDYFRADGNTKPHNWLVKAAATLLGVNYRLGLRELNVLDDLGRNVLHKLTVGRIAQTCYGYDLAEEAKKNEPPESTEPSPPSSSPSPTGDATQPESLGTSLAAEH